MTNPDSVRLFGLLAAVFVRLDRCERCDELTAQAGAIGAYARDELQEIVDNDEVFGGEERSLIRETARRLLVELDG